MISFGTSRRASRVVAAFAAFAAPCACVLAAADAEELERQILANIEEIRARDGQYSPALRDELMRLIVL